MKIPAMVMLGKSSFISASLNMIRQKAYIRQSLSLILWPRTLSEHKKDQISTHQTFILLSFVVRDKIEWDFEIFLH